MTMLFTDLVGSTRLKEELGNTEAVRLILEHHALVRGLLKGYADGFEISTAGDSFFLAFRRPSDAVAFALRLQGRVERWNQGLRAKLLDRIGIHTGEVTVEVGADGQVHDLHGLEVDKCARVMSLGREHHILVTRFAFENARASLKGVVIPEVGPLDWVSHGMYVLKGVAEPMEICEVAESGRTGLLAPEDSEKAHKVPGGAPAERPGVGAAAVSEAEPGISPRDRGRLRWILAAGLAVAGWLGLAVPSLVTASYDLAYWMRPVEPPAEAVLVQMDRKSHDELKQPWMGQWDRAIHGALIDRMREAGARAVVFDVVFDKEREDVPVQDERLVEAARRATNVCVAGERRNIEREGLSLVENVGPFPALEAVTRWGVSWFPARVDEVVRHPYLGNEQKEGLAAATVRMLGKEPPSRGSGIWLNYYGPPSTFAWHSYSDVMMNRVPASEFAGKLVFVGAVYDLGYPGGRRLDDFPTPYSARTGRRSPGVEVVATSVLNFLNGESLRRTSWAIEWGVLAAAGGALGFGLTRIRWGWGLLVALGAGAFVGLLGMGAVWMTRVWFPWLVVLVIQIPLALAGAGALRALELTAVRRDRPRRAGVAGGPGAAERAAGRWNALGTGASKEGAGRVVPSDPPPRPGVAAGGVAVSIPDYQLVRVIGRGAYGTVWLARDAVGSVRALKVVERRSFGEARPYEREFDGIRRFMPVSLEHPGLIRVFHVGRDDAAGFFYYVMEAADDMKSRDLPDRGDWDPAGYVPRTLDAELRARGGLPAAEALELGIHLGRALKFLHDRQLIHRDIKPANVLYARGQPRLGDIGLVTAMAPSDGRVSFLGTKGYMAPEGPGTATADVYSLGKLLYVAVTGADPEEFPAVPQGIERASEGRLLQALGAVWLKACEPEADRRMPSVDDWLTSLGSIHSEHGRNEGKAP
ncbi:MAG: CHASE2 domain-containing protein [Limisphaerales bacterium]